MKKEEIGISLMPVGKDEMNLAEFPITLLSKKLSPDIKTIEFSDTIIGEENKPVKREWIVTGTDKFGLPLAHDNDVWIALLCIGKESNFESRKVNFTRYRLCKIMGWKKTGKAYKRIEEALNRLKGLSIYAKNAFWDNEKKSYVTDSFGIIDNYRIFDMKDSDSPPFSYVNLNEIIFNSIKSGYIKSLNMEIYFNLKSVIGKRLFRYLDKKRYGHGKFEINLFTLAYSHIGFNDEGYKYASDIKKKLDPAHKELMKAGFIKSAEYLPTADGRSEKIVYIFGKKAELPEGNQAEEKVKDTTEGGIIQALVDAGITPAVAEQLIREYPSQVVESQLRALPFRNAREPAAVLIRSIQENWSPPAGIGAQAKREKQKKAEIQRQDQEEQEKADRRSKIENYLSSLQGWTSSLDQRGEGSSATGGRSLV